MKRLAAVSVVLFALCLAAPAVETQLTTDSSDDRSPAWSPDGTTIAFSSDRVAGYADIWLMDAGGEALGASCVTTNDDRWHEFNPSWYPSGAYLAFETDDYC